MGSNSKPYFDENEWVVQIRRNLDEELGEEFEVPVSIFIVPKSLMILFPTCYVPQEIPIGPYHYFKPEYYEMERYKIAAARRVQKHNKSLKLDHVADQLMRHDQRIRDHYDRYLNFNGETLAWMMVVDASFLLEFLQGFVAREGTGLTRVPSRASRFIDHAGTKSVQNTILRDIVMLENQIPLFLLRKVLEFQLSSLGSADELLVSILVGFYKEISPIKSSGELPNAQLLMTKSAHLLDFLYHAIVPQVDGQSGDNEIHPEQDEVKESEQLSFEKSSYAQKFLQMIWKALSRLMQRPILKPFQVILKLPWRMVSNLPVLKMLKVPIENLFSPLMKEEGKAEGENTKPGLDKPPRMEEIDIPSVTDLAKAGIKFVPSYLGIFSVHFEVKTRTLNLPIVSIDVNSEVVLRNLVAYEASNDAWPMVFTRYLELMNGIIDTDRDVKILRENGIILNHLKKDGEVTKLWNGTGRAIRLTSVGFLDKTIADVNKYYNGTPMIKFKRLVTHYVFESWKFFTLAGAILMLLLMAIQSFCSVYSCPRFFNGVQNFH